MTPPKNTLTAPLIEDADSDEEHSNISEESKEAPPRLPMPVKFLTLVINGFAASKAFVPVQVMAETLLHLPSELSWPIAGSAGLPAMFFYYESSTKILAPPANKHPNHIIFSKPSTATQWIFGGCYAVSSTALVVMFTKGYPSELVYMGFGPCTAITNTLVGTDKTERVLNLAEEMYRKICPREPDQHTAHSLENQLKATQQQFPENMSIAIGNYITTPNDIETNNQNNETTIKVKVKLNTSDDEKTLQLTHDQVINLIYDAQEQSVDKVTKTHYATSNPTLQVWLQVFAISCAMLAVTSNYEAVLKCMQLLLEKIQVPEEWQWPAYGLALPFVVGPAGINIEYAVPSSQWWSAYFSKNDFTYKYPTTTPLNTQSKDCSDYTSLTLYGCLWGISLGLTLLQGMQGFYYTEESTSANDELTVECNFVTFLAILTTVFMVTTKRVATTNALLKLFGFRPKETERKEKINGFFDQQLALAENALKTTIDNVNNKTKDKKISLKLEREELQNYGKEKDPATMIYRLNQRTNYYTMLIKALTTSSNIDTNVYYTSKDDLTVLTTQDEELKKHLSDSPTTITQTPSFMTIKEEEEEEEEEKEGSTNTSPCSFGWGLWGGNERGIDIDDDDDPNDGQEPGLD